MLLNLRASPTHPALTGWPHLKAPARCGSDFHAFALGSWTASSTNRFIDLLLYTEVEMDGRVEEAHPIAGAAMW